MAQSPQSVSYFARTNFRATERLFGIRQADRLSHVYMVGKTGVGKSSLIETLALQDLAQGRGFALLDPHGDLVERIWTNATPLERERITYLDATDPHQPFGYNPLRRVRDDRIPLAAAGLLETMRKLWPDAWGVRMEHVLRNCLYALLERDSSTLPDILLMLSNKPFRSRVTREIRNETVQRFWKSEFDNYSFRLRADSIAPIQNKLGALLSDPTLFRLLVAPVHDVHVRALMDQGGVMLVNVSKGQLGEDSALVLGSLLVSTIALAAFSRADQPWEERRPFFLYADEFHNFTTLSFVNMMSELRKYGVGLTLAHQHLDQLEPEVRHAVFGNVATLISFRIGAKDAPLIARELQPTFEILDLLNLANHDIYLKLMIDGSPSHPFSARTIDPRSLPRISQPEINRLLLPH